MCSRNGQRRLKHKKRTKKYRRKPYILQYRLLVLSLWSFYTSTPKSYNSRDIVYVALKIAFTKSFSSATVRNYYYLLDNTKTPHRQAGYEYFRGLRRTYKTVKLDRLTRWETLQYSLLLLIFFCLHTIPIPLDFIEFYFYTSRSELLFVNAKT